MYHGERYSVYKEATQSRIIMTCSYKYGIDRLMLAAKGPAFHTGTFMRGYNDGFDACSGNNNGNNRGNGEDDGGSSRSSGYEFTVRISDWPFGSSSVRIDIETENGYRDSTSITTAVSGTPSHTFNIPQNQGNSVYVCTDPEGILAFGTCQTFITNSRDSSGTISAR